MTSERALQQMRQRIFGYPAEKDDQDMRVLYYLKVRHLRCRNQQPLPTGPYSGLTRSELRQSGTCETDWY